MTLGLIRAGDVEHKGNNFLAVIDVDPASESYGRLMTTIVTDQQTVRVHHTEYVMPASGMLFANSGADTPSGNIGTAPFEG